MANIVYPNTFVASTPARASEVNANFAAISAQVNGNLGEVNLANNAVTTAKIADDQVTLDKLSVSPLVYGDTPTIGVGTSFSGVTLGASAGSTALLPSGILTAYLSWPEGNASDVVFEINRGSFWMELPAASSLSSSLWYKQVQVFSTGSNIRARRVVSTFAAGTILGTKHAVTA